MKATHEDLPHGGHRFVVPVTITAPGNGQVGHWSRRVAKARRIRETTAAVLLMARPTAAKLHVVIITRCGPRRMDEDNCVAGCKPVRDEVARWLGVVDDGDRERVRFVVRQEREARAHVRVDVYQVEWSEELASHRVEHVGWAAYAWQTQPPFSMWFTKAMLEDGLERVATSRGLSSLDEAKREAVDLACALLGIDNNGGAGW